MKAKTGVSVYLCRVTKTFINFKLTFECFHRACTLCQTTVKAHIEDILIKQSKINKTHLKTSFYHKLKMYATLGYT